MDLPLSSRAPSLGDADIKPAPATTNDKPPDHEDLDLTAGVLRNGVTVGPRLIWPASTWPGGRVRCPEMGRVSDDGSTPVRPPWRREGA
jgi:hypothetical protein